MAHTIYFPSLRGQSLVLFADKYLKIYFSCLFSKLFKATDMGKIQSPLILTEKESSNLKF